MILFAGIHRRNRILLVSSVVVMLLIDRISVIGLSPESSSHSRDHAGSSRLNVAATAYGNADDRRKESLRQGQNPLVSLNLNLDALAQSGAAPRAQQLLERIHALYEEGYYEVSPDIVSYNSVLKAWKEEKNPDQAYELLQDMLRKQTKEIQVDAISLNTVIIAFANSGNYRKAEALLRQMQQRDDLPDPDLITFNSVLYALSASPDPTTAIKAENLLREMMSSECRVSPDTISFNTVIYAWSQMADQDTQSAAKRSQELLEHMEQLSAAGNSNVVPDVFSYTTVIQAWARCGQPARAEKVFERMKDWGLEPNRYTYTAVMSSLAKGGDPQRAETIHNEMMEAYEDGYFELKPDTISFSAVIDGWAKLSHVDKPEAAERALALLKQMKDLESEGMGPNAITYTSVLSALAKKGTWEACEEARDILAEMDDEYQNGKHWLKPTTIQYNAVLLAYARSPRADKALKAAAFFKLMANHPDPNCRPDTITYNTLLMASSNAFGNEELKSTSFQVASTAFQECVRLGNDPTSHIGPTSSTFAHFCKAARRLIHKAKMRDEILQKTLTLCLEKGLLSPTVVQQVQTSCRSEKEWKQRAGKLADFVGWKERFRPLKVPTEWVCNARR
mmetsp:Transcript_9834/g.28541  ORF Transcript_9834/g.28541 Transcript_9834/m.28541 type:complete len:620 (-) Transcript_9834:150-2009(-)